MEEQKKVTITIDGKNYDATEGETILTVAKRNKVHIPTLCFHEDLGIKANCRLCLVEIEGKQGLFTSCSTQVANGMNVSTKSVDIEKARRINLELILAEHCVDCSNCIWNYNCTLKNLAKEFGAKFNRFPKRKEKAPRYRFGPSIYFDSSKCIDCRNCVEACQKQNVNYLEIRERGHLFQVCPSNKDEKDCVYCGQCVTHCPVGALQAAGEFEEVEKPLADKDKIVVFQFAPSIRSSIGEEFGIPYGTVQTEQMTAAIRKLGANYVFDTNVGADFTTIEEANELIERVVENEGLPMFTSCCPAWVKYVEFYHPELVPNLTTVRSPQIILGGLIKTYWAQQKKIDPKNIVVVSIMPCTSKKFERTREQILVNGLRPVDYVLTTRELAYLFTRHKIDLKTIKPEKTDEILRESSGAAVIYGASGGVMESALRTALDKLSGESLPKIEYEAVRGIDGIKRAEVEVAGKKLKVAVVNELGNAEKLIQELKEDPHKYDYVEVMACRGGCIGGGGQPVPVNDEIRRKRAEALYSVDKNAPIRKAHESPVIKEVYKTFFANKRNIKKVCYTHFIKRRKRIALKKLVGRK